MAINPTDYDIAGLRELALDRDRRRSEQHATGDGSSLDELAEHDRRVAWLGSYEERHKPYLRRIPQRAELRGMLREWLERLVDRVGPAGAADALHHYERLGWLTESTGAELRAALPEPDDHEEGSVEELTRVDHVHGLSVVALAQLGAEGEALAVERAAASDPTTRHAPGTGSAED